MAETRIVIVGAGVSGLTSALLLSKHPRYKITVVAKHMPGDYDTIEYASPWAGANYLPVSAPNTAAAQHDRDTWPELRRLATEEPGAGVHFQEARNFSRSSDNGPIAKWHAEPQNPNAWFKELVPNFRLLEPHELRAHDRGTAFTSVCINTALYLPYLLSRCLAAGVLIKRGVVTHISDAAALFQEHPPATSPASHAAVDKGVHAAASSGGTVPLPQQQRDVSVNGKGSESGRADVVINCTGLGSGKLGGVRDSAMYPARGQTVLVRNEAPFMACTSGTDDGEEEACYVMQRAAGGGTILGGCAQPHNWAADVDPNLAVRIMKRCVELVPELVASGGGESGADMARLSVIRHGVGLRPCREGGVRLERELVGVAGTGEGEGEEEKGAWVVHNYGHGGFGYQSSYGCAMEVVRLVGTCVEEMKGAVVRD